MSEATPTYLPPRQPHQPVQRIAKWALVTISTVVIVGALYLFFRGTQPRRVTFSQASPAAQISPIADGWMQGLPDQPVATEPPPKPVPPVDEEARRDLKRLQQQQEAREEQHRKALEEIRKLLAEKPKPTPTPAATPKTVKRPTLGFISHERKAEDLREDDLLLATSETISGVLETILNSEVEGYFLIRTTRPILDSVTHTRVIAPQGQRIIAKDTSSALLFGNERIPTFAVTLSLPGGREVDLGDAPVMDATGTNGLTGEINNHVWRIIWTSLLKGGLQGGQQMLQQAIAADQGGAIASGVIQQGNMVTQQRLGRAQDTRPTIVAHAGEIVNVLVLKSIHIPATTVAQR